MEPNAPRQLTPAESSKISAGLFRGANYLIRLCERMNNAGFAHDDKIFVLARKAQEEMQYLCTAVHYASCESGIGRSKADDQ